MTVTCKPRPLLPAWVSERFFFFWSFKFKPCKEEEIMERYEIVKDIGSGNFGVAKLVRDKWTRELLAVKFIERGQKVWEYWIGLIFLSGLPSFPLGSLFLVDEVFCWSCRLMNMCKGKSWTTDHWSILILSDSKRYGFNCLYFWKMLIFFCWVLRCCMQ